MYIVLALLTLASFAAAVTATFTGHWGVAMQQAVICLLAANTIRAERRIDRLVMRNIVLWQQAQHTKQGATPEGEHHE